MENLTSGKILFGVNRGKVAEYIGKYSQYSTFVTTDILIEIAAVQQELMTKNYVYARDCNIYIFETGTENDFNETRLEYRLKSQKLLEKIAIKEFLESEILEFIEKETK